MTRDLIGPWTLITLLLLGGCGGLAEDDDDDSTGDASYEIAVESGGGSAPVDLFDLDPTDVDGALTVTVEDVLDAAGVTGPDGYTYGFAASDGYSRDGYTWDQASQATLVQETGDLQWPEDLGMEGADHVDGVVTIELTAAGG